MALASPKEKEIIHILSLLAINPEGSGEAYAAFERLSERERDELLSLADSNHVVLRALVPLQATAVNGIATNVGIADWTGARIEHERGRIAKALASLYEICR